MALMMFPIYFHLRKQTLAIAPEKLQNFISCGCKTNCSNNMCTCFKNGLKCMSSSSVCRGLDCANAMATQNIVDDNIEDQLEPTDDPDPDI